jgi:hypothetical protein
MGRNQGLKGRSIYTNVQALAHLDAFRPFSTLTEDGCLRFLAERARMKDSTVFPLVFALRSVLEGITAAASSQGDRRDPRVRGFATAPAHGEAIPDAR